MFRGGGTLELSGCGLTDTHNVSYIIRMICSFADRAAKAFFNGGKCPPKWRQFSEVLARKLDMLDAAVALGDLASPPGNRLEALKGGRQEQWSIRINDKWRICFHWTERGPAEVEIVDYHG